MAKPKTLFYCSNCGYKTSKWLGKCPSCGEWNTFVEEVLIKDDKRKSGNRNAGKQDVTRYNGSTQFIAVRNKANEDNVAQGKTRDTSTRQANPNTTVSIPQRRARQSST